jgi:hypothetical protein
LIVETSNHPIEFAVQQIRLPIETDNQLIKFAVQHIGLVVEAGNEMIKSAVQQIGLISAPSDKRLQRLRRGIDIAQLPSQSIDDSHVSLQIYAFETEPGTTRVFDTGFPTSSSEMTWMALWRQASSALCRRKISVVDVDVVELGIPDDLAANGVAAIEFRCAQP